MRKLSKIEGVEFDTGADTFDAGTRRIYVSFTAKGVRVRLARTSAVRFVPWGKVYDVAAAIVADFNASPRTGRITRGKVS